MPGWRRSTTRAASAGRSSCRSSPTRPGPVTRSSPSSGASRRTRRWTWSSAISRAPIAWPCPPSQRSSGSSPSSSTAGPPGSSRRRSTSMCSAAHTGIDGIGAARYLLTDKPDVKTVAGLNQDYAWGRDSWEIFIRALRKLKPDVQVVETLWPKLFQGDLSAEISKLLTAKPDVVFHSLWGTDLASVNSQGRVRGLFRQSLVIHNNSAFLFKEFRDLPEGFVVGFRGTHWPEVPDPAKNPLQKEFVERCTKKFGEPCGSPHGSYHMVQALQGVKAAYEKAIKTTGRWPGVEDVVRAFEYLEFDSPSGRIATAVGGGHQAIEDSL